MNPQLNRIPDPVHDIHLIAVCGTAMGALACMLKEMGFAVTGSDRRVYPPMSTYLAQQGIFVADGFNASHLAHRPDLVVVGNAVTRDNPEAVRLQEMGLHYCSLPQALNHFAAAGKQAVVVAGTHGKTTTSALLSWVLYCAGKDPAFMVGGILKNFDRNYRLGRGGIIVLEGDEYDTAFFDKGPKFLHFGPKAAVLTGVEFDHADIFRDLDHVKQAFGDFVRKLSPDTLLLTCDAGANTADVTAEGSCRILRYGKTPEAYWRLGPARVSPPWTMFEVFKNGFSYGAFQSPLMGEHNRMNALAVIGVADHLGVSPEAARTALARFAGIRRRQEVRGVRNGITVMDDFAHHPTAVKETLAAVKPFCSDGRLVAVFEPRTNTSMRDVFQDAYARAFDAADLVCVRRPPLLSKIPEEHRFSSQRLVADLRSREIAARFFPDTESIIAFLVPEARPGDVLLVMSNGGFDNIHERLLASL